MAGSVAVLFGKKAGKIGELQLDATLSENHEYTNEISAFPVETGADIVDNIKLNPEKITINGVVSNSPITVLYSDVSDIVERNGNINSAKRISRDGTPTRVETAQAILLRILGRKISGFDEPPQLVDVVTGLRVYTNMAMAKLTINRTGKTGQALPFTAEFIQIQQVQSETVLVPNPQPASADKASGNVNKGNQTTKPANAEQEKKVKSVGKAIIGFFTN